MRVNLVLKMFNSLDVPAKCEIPCTFRCLIVWKQITFATLRKFKRTTSTSKIMCTVFWDRKYVISVESQNQKHRCQSFWSNIQNVETYLLNIRRDMFSDCVMSVIVLMIFSHVLHVSVFHNANVCYDPLRTR